MREEGCVSKKPALAKFKEIGSSGVQAASAMQQPFAISELGVRVGALRYNTSAKGEVASRIDII